MLGTVLPYDRPRPDRHRPESGDGGEAEYDGDTKALGGETSRGGRGVCGAGRGG